MPDLTRRDLLRGAVGVAAVAALPLPAPTVEQVTYGFTYSPSVAEALWADKTFKKATTQSLFTTGHLRPWRGVVFLEEGLGDA